MRCSIRDVAISGLMLAGLVYAPSQATPRTNTEKQASAPPAQSVVGFDPQRALADLRKAIAGKESEPSEKVFKNIQNFKGVPAGRLLGAMEKGFSPALGVSCIHCHDPERWENDDKDKKQIARGMMKLASEINEKLKEVPGMTTAKPMVNCTTCHRGQVKPALNLDDKGHR